MPTTLHETWFRRNFPTLLGWALQLVVLGVYIGRQEQITRQMEIRVAKLEERMTVHHEDHQAHVNVEWRSLVLGQLKDLNSKLDQHQAETLRLMSRGR